MYGPGARSESGGNGVSWAPRARLPEPPFLVAGLGRAGRSAARVLRDTFGPERVWAWDTDTSAGMQRVRRELEAEGIRTSLAPRASPRDVDFARTVVKSPGIPFSSQVIAHALNRGRLVIDELELGWRLTRAPVLAVTGTNGKSTVSGLAHGVLRAAGHRVELAGNTEFGDPLSTTALRALDWIVCETSSYQLEGCVSVLPEVGVFTNLTLEHLGRHRTLERYGQMKRRLFVDGERCVPCAVVDIDTPFGTQLAVDVELRGGTVSRVGSASAADYRVLNATWDLRSGEATIGTPSGEVTIRSRLPGAYNARNLAAGLAIADLLGIPRSISVPALRDYPGTPGRFEQIDEDQPYEVIVDFAHTPDAIEQFLVTVRTGMPRTGRLIVVFGLGSRPGTAMERMGRVSAGLSDHLILTTSGFRANPPIPGLASMLTGARTTAARAVEIILDRRRAFARGIGLAQADDVVVIPGRGALTHMRTDPRGEPRPFDDRTVVRELIRDASLSERRPPSFPSR